ncbi:MAG: cysteine peptidase family C39 domain-containing protein [Planctomycetaceae bacterium]
MSLLMHTAVGVCLCGTNSLQHVRAQEVGETKAVGQSQDPRLAEIAAALRSWRDEIETIELRYIMKFVEGSGPPAFPGSIWHFEWIRDAEANVFSHRFDTLDDKVYSREASIAAFDQRYSMIYPQGESKYERPDKVHVFPRRMPMVDQMSMGRNQVRPLDLMSFQGRRGEDLWIDELLTSKPAEIVATETIDGAGCPVVRLEIYPGHPQFVVFDPRYDHLPREMRFESGIRSNSVSEFRQLPSGKWFPWAGIFEIRADDFYSIQSWEVEEAEINRPVDPLVFEPPLQVGTLVVDAFHGMPKVHRWEEFRPLLEAEFAERARNNLRPSGQEETEPRDSIPQGEDFSPAPNALSMAARLLGKSVTRRQLAEAFENDLMSRLTITDLRQAAEKLGLATRLVRVSSASLPLRELPLIVEVGEDPRWIHFSLLYGQVEDRVQRVDFPAPPMLMRIDPWFNELSGYGLYLSSSPEDLEGISGVWDMNVIFALIFVGTLLIAGVVSVWKKKEKTPAPGMVEEETSAE